MDAVVGKISHRIRDHHDPPFYLLRSLIFDDFDVKLLVICYHVPRLRRCA